MALEDPARNHSQQSIGDLDHQIQSRQDTTVGGPGWRTWIGRCASMHKDWNPTDFELFEDWLKSWRVHALVQDVRRHDHANSFELLVRVVPLSKREVRIHKRQGRPETVDAWMLSASPG